MELPNREDYLSHLAYDSVVFGFAGDQLRILVMEYHNTGLYALPGGFVKQDEDLDRAVKRGLFERTGLEQVYLEQSHVFGDRSRHDAPTMRVLMEANGYQVPEKHWLLERFISVSYYALIDHSKVTLAPDALSDSINWYALDALPPLIFDHRQIVEKALESLRNNLDQKLLGMNLLPEQFTMKELQRVYEAILGTPLGRTAFQRKMLALKVLKRHGKHYDGSANKAPYLYSFEGDL